MFEEILQLVEHEARLSVFNRLMASVLAAYRKQLPEHRTLRQAAADLGIPHTTLLKRVQRGTFPAVFDEESREWYVPVSVISDQLEKTVLALVDYKKRYIKACDEAERKFRQKHVVGA